MGLTFSLTDRYKEVGMVFVTSSQVQWHLMSARMNIPVPQVVHHMDENGSVQVLRSHDTVRTYTFTIDLDSDDSPDETVSRVKRWVDGASAQAVRSYRQSDVNPIYLLAARPNSSGKYIPRVIYGYVDDGAVYSNVNLVNDESRNVKVTLVCEPYSDAMHTVIRDNICPVHLHQETARGLSDSNDNWTITSSGTRVGGLINKYCWYFSGSADETDGDGWGNGVETDVVSVAANTLIRGFVWWRVAHTYSTAGTYDGLVIQLWDDTNGVALDRKSLEPRDGDIVKGVHYDISRPDKYGNVWYRTPLVAQSPGTTADIQIRVLSYTGNTILTDGFYLELDNPVETENLFPTPYMDYETAGLVTGWTSSGGTVSQSDGGSFGDGRLFGRYGQSVSGGGYVLRTFTPPVDVEHITAIVWVRPLPQAATSTGLTVQFGAVSKHLSSTSTDESSGYFDALDGSRYHRIAITIPNIFGAVTLTIDNDTVDDDCDIASVYIYDSSAVENICSEVASPYAAGHMDRGWCGNREWRPRVDEDASNPERHHWLDVWGIGGDSPAYVQHQIEMQDVGVLALLSSQQMSRLSGGTGLPLADVIHYIEAGDTSPAWSIVGTNWTKANGSSAGNHGGVRAEFTHATSSSNTGSVQCDIGASEIKKLRSHKYRVYIAISSASAGTIEMTGFSGFSVDSEPVDISVTGFQHYDLGTIVPTTLPSNIYAAVSANQGITFTLTSSVSGGVFYLDGLWLIPFEEEAFLIGDALMSAASNSFYIMPKERAVYSTQFDGMANALGGCYTASPGVCNRFYFMITYGLFRDLTLEGRWRLRITPRARHLGDV